MAEIPPSAERSPRRRRWLRFSLRTGLLLTTVVAVTLGLAHHRIERQRRAVEAIEALGGIVIYEWQMQAQLTGQGARLQPPGPQWVRDWLGPHALDRVVALHIDSVRYRVRDKLSAILAHAAVLQSVHSITISGQDIDRAAGRLLAKFESLEFFHGSNLYLTPEAADELAHAPRLQTISFENVAITTPALAALAESQTLHSLRLTGVVTTPPVLEGLLVLPIDDKFEFLTQAIDLQAATAPNATAPQPDWLADEGLLALTRCKQLRSLTLSTTRVTDAGVAELRHLKQLDSLSLDSPLITGKSLAAVATLPNLQTLYVEKARLAADDLTALAAASKLHSLHLRTDLSDEFAPRLAELTQLDSLFLEGPGMTDACLPDFHKCQHLRQLNLRYTSVQPLGPAAQALRQALPGCSITLPYTPQQLRRMRAAAAFPSAVSTVSP
jgi:hypothetical protein